jgi:ADP-ribose pyrophosphatase
MELDRTINSKKTYSGKMIDVRIDEIILESGKSTLREVVEHDPTVAIVPIDNDGNIILVNQYRHPAKKYVLEVPAGLIDPGEDPDKAALRELMEETGYGANSLNPIGRIWASPGFTDEYMHCYIARDLFPKKLPHDDDEEISIRKIPISETHTLIKNGIIDDSKTISLILMASTLEIN